MYQIHKKKYWTKPITWLIAGSHMILLYFSLLMCIPSQSPLECFALSMESTKRRLTTNDKRRTRPQKRITMAYCRVMQLLLLFSVQYVDVRNKNWNITHEHEILFQFLRLEEKIFFSESLPWTLSNFTGHITTVHKTCASFWSLFIYLHLFKTLFHKDFLSLANTNRSCSHAIKLSSISVKHSCLIISIHHKIQSW